MCRTFCAPCNLGVQTLFIQEIKSFDKNHVLHHVLKLKKKIQEEDVRVISAFFTCSKLLENADLYVCLFLCFFVCLDLEPFHSFIYYAFWQSIQGQPTYRI